MAFLGYAPGETEKKWLAVWQKQGLYRAKDETDKPKSYLLIEFPYPSGERLHVGHARSYCCLDAVARKRRMQGYNVLFPIGWDAFGLPAENYAIKTGIHPAVTTATNIGNARVQAMAWGLSFDWEREVNTTDPGYYKWTQWIFVQLFRKGLAYKAEIAVNWCPKDKINLANEEVIDGKCERCGTETERRTQSQWLLAITKYADRLLDDLKTVNFREDIALSQINWIGRKAGAKLVFTNDAIDLRLDVFTTRIDTVFGVTFVAVAPEAASNWIEKVPKAKKAGVEAYVAEALNKSERERKQKTEKTGVDTGLTVKNPANGQEVPVWVADYVMMDVGTGAVMGVPAHDGRDFQFAKRQGLPIVEVVAGGKSGEVYEGEGRLVNSGKYTGMESGEAREKMVADGLGEKSQTYHLRDWVFSRQHYWGEPIPMVFCEKCAKDGISLIKEGEVNGEFKGMAGWFPVSESDLPVKLPQVEKYQPTGTGESPLAAMTEWVNTKCPVCGGPARRETDTMPNWAGSSWYYLRYIDPHNDRVLADPAKLRYWLPVDWYNGGMEHTTLHLLYSRFWHKFLFDLGVVPTSEPYAKRTSHGVILGPDGRKMSKSRGNVINPDEVVTKFGADTLRLYEMFIGPFDQTVAWNWEGVEGVHRFLKRVWGLAIGCQLSAMSSPEAKRRMAKLKVKVEEDLEAMKFNTAVAAMMETLNWWGEHETEVGKDMVTMWVVIMAPIAPFMAEEMFFRLTGGKMGSVHEQKWPEVNPADLGGGKVTVAISVNGKVRGKLELETGRAKEQGLVVSQALELENVKKYIGEKQYRVVFVPGRLVNLVVV